MNSDQSSLTYPDACVLRRALIRARKHYCTVWDASGWDGIEDPDDEIKAAFALLGLEWQGDTQEILNGDEWNGNEQAKREISEGIGVECDG